jgi:hypothetical protein
MMLLRNVISHDYSSEECYFSRSAISSEEYMLIQDSPTNFYPHINPKHTTQHTPAPQKVDSCLVLPCLVLSCLVLSSPVISMRKSLHKWGVGSNKIDAGPTEPSTPRAILIDLPAEYVVDGFVDIQDDVVLSVDPSIAALLANPSRLLDVVGKSTTHFAFCCWEGDRSAMSAFSDMAAGSRDWCRTPSVISGKQLEWTAFKSKARVNRCVLLATTVREHQERAVLSLEVTTSSSYETSPSANGSAIAAGCYLHQHVLDKAINLRLEAKHASQRQRIDVLEKEKEQALLSNELLARKNERLESDLLEERNQGQEAESKVIEERNLRLEVQQVVQSNWIDELEKVRDALALSDKNASDLAEVTCENVAAALALSDQNASNLAEVTSKNVTDALALSDQTASNLAVVTSKNVADALALSDSKMITLLKISERKASAAKCVADKNSLDALTVSDSATASALALTVTNTRKAKAVSDENALAAQAENERNKLLALLAVREKELAGQVRPILFLKLLFLISNHHV